MTNPEPLDRKWTESANANGPAFADSSPMFKLLFERSMDPIWLLDPQTGLFVDCNQAAVDLMGCACKSELLASAPAQLSPDRQPDGRPSRDVAAAITARVEREGGLRFEWTARRLDGRELPLEVVATRILCGEQPIHVIVSRDISERKCFETEIRTLSETLERRVRDRTAQLVASNELLTSEISVRRTAESLLKQSEERLRTLVEHAPDAIVVLDGDTGRFLSCNENATRLYGLDRDTLLKLGPADVSPPVQPNGRFSTEAALEWIRQAADGRTPVFEWMHRHSSGRLLPCEVRLVRLPAGERNLIRGSVIDNTERHRREDIQRATYEISEAVHAARDLHSLYARIHSIIKGLMPANNFYIAVYDAATELISFPYHVDEVTPRPTAFKPTTGLTGLVLRTGRPLLVGRASDTRKRHVGNAVTIEGVPGGSYIESGVPAAIWLGVPLTLDGRPIGVMAVQDYHNDTAYGEDEKRILTFVASQIALAIDRKRAQQELLDRSQRILRHRNVMVELAQLDKSNFDFALQRICALAARTLDVARVSYWSLQGRDTTIRCEMLCLASQGEPVPEARGAELHEHQCPAYFAALASQEPIIATRADLHPATSGLADGYLRPLGITSLLDAPIWLHGRVVGVLCHEHTGPPREWTSEEVDFAASLATMVTVAFEAAQRARWEQALRESEEKFRALFEASSQGVIIHDAHGYLEVNPAAVRMMGCRHAGELIGKNPAETSPPFQPGGESSAVLARRHVERCMTDGSARFDWVCRTAQGVDLPLEVILTRVEMGGRSLIQAVMNDISERKKAEAALQQRHREVTTLLDTLPGYAFFKDAHGRYLMANKNFCRVAGCSSESIAGRTDADLFPPPLAARLARNDQPLLAAGQPLVVDEDEMIDEGRLRTIQTTKVPVRNERGDVVGLIGVGVDITERKRVETELIRALAREKELSQLKTDFVSMVSHEFRTPLGIIMSSADILADYLDSLPAEDRLHHLQSIHKNTRRMSELMEEVLVLSRFDAGRMDFKPVPLPLTPLFRRLIDELASAAAQPFTIEFTTGPMPVEAHADEKLLRHIFINLISNAVKYSDPDRPVNFAVHRDGIDAVCTVTDRGIGIPEADLEWLFNAFHRGRNVGQRPGTGLGLVIVKRCVELHGGRIELKSAVGQGTTVTVRLPLFPDLTAT